MAAEFKNVVVDFVLQVSPTSPDAAFVEIEVDGKSIRLGKWIKRPDGLWAIRFTKADMEALEAMDNGH